MREKAQHLAAGDRALRPRVALNSITRSVLVQVRNQRALQIQEGGADLNRPLEKKVRWREGDYKDVIIYLNDSTIRGKQHMT